VFYFLYNKQRIHNTWEHNQGKNAGFLAGGVITIMPKSHTWWPRFQPVAVVISPSGME